MTDFSGEFLVQTSQSASGSIKVYDWAKCRVMINKQVIDPVYSMSCTRSADISAGDATIKFLDPTKTLSALINPGDELEIFLSEQSPLLIANKVWGGYVDSSSFNVDNKIVLEVKGKEYSNNLILNITASTAQSNKNSFSGVEPGTAIIALMTNYQVDFTTEGVLTGTGSTLTADYLNKSLFDAIKSICDGYGYVFYISLDKDLVVRKQETVVAVPVTDYLTYTGNMNSIKEEYNKELLCNDVIVYGKTSGVVSNSGSPTQDATSIARYGTNAKRIVVPSLTTNTDCNNFAAAYIAAYKDPLLQYRTNSRLVAYSDPLEYITVTSSKSEVSGTYQIREIAHDYQKAIKTTMVLSKKVSDLSMSLGQLLGRVQAIEVKNFV
jgi:hypothetical protein